MSLTGARLEIGSKIRADLLASAAQGYPGEACGILLGRIAGDTRVIEGFRPTPNRWAERDDRYLVDSESLRRALAAEEAGGATVLGFYHSHPDAPPVPSETDRELAWPWYAYVIIRVAAGEAEETRAWELDMDSGHFEERPIRYT
ncbi:MAG: M67 family metallopeptidase [Gemmatimonadales bacterium]